MRTTRNTILGLTVMGFMAASGTQASAQTPPRNPHISRDYWRCMGAVNIQAANPQVQAAFLNCARREQTAQDARLKAALESAQGALDEPGKQRFGVLQQAWVRLRDDNCTFFSTARSMPENRAFDRAKCVMEWTAIRAWELQEVFYSG